MNRIYTFFAILFTFTSPLIIMTGINYGLYLFFAIISLLAILNRNSIIVLPKRYCRLLMLLFIIILINSIISPYTPSFQYIILGTCITCLPFFHYILSGNFKFKKNETSRLIDFLILSTIIICLFCMIESFINVAEKKEGLWYSKIFGLGFVSSFCNQSIALSLYRYKQSNNRKYIKIVIFLALFIVLTMQLKAIIGCLLLLSGYYLFTHKRRGAYLKLGLIMCFLIAILFSLPLFRDKVDKYVNIYITEGASDGVARNALYFVSGKIALDFFPLGTGQGTFASVASRLTHDRVLEDYGISDVYGLNVDDGAHGSFLLDTHWANILGENGLLGLILYMTLFIYPIIDVWRINKKHRVPVEYRFLVTTSIVVLIIESMVLPLPNRISFIFLYAGLMPIIFKNEIKPLNIQMVAYESSINK